VTVSVRRPAGGGADSAPLNPPLFVTHCYRCDVAWSVCVSLGTTASCAKTTKPVEVPFETVPILSVFPALIVHSELKSVHPGFPVAFIFLSTS